MTCLTEYLLNRALRNLGQTTTQWWETSLKSIGILALTSSKWNWISWTTVHSLFKIQADRWSTTSSLGALNRSMKKLSNSFRTEVLEIIKVSTMTTTSLASHESHLEVEWHHSIRNPSRSTFLVPTTSSLKCSRSLTATLKTTSMVGLLMLLPRRCHSLSTRGQSPSNLVTPRWRTSLTTAKSSHTLSFGILT